MEEFFGFVFIFVGLYLAYKTLRVLIFMVSWLNQYDSLLDIILNRKRRPLKSSGTKKTSKRTKPKQQDDKIYGKKVGYKCHGTLTTSRGATTKCPSAGIWKCGNCNSAGCKNVNCSNAAFKSGDLCTTCNQRLWLK